MSDTSQQQSGLKAGSVHLAGLVAQSLGTNEPQLAIIVVGASVALFAGGATPGALLIAAIGFAGFLYLMAKFSGIVGDAGGLYTIASEGLGRRAGACAGCFMLVAFMVAIPMLFIAAGFLAQAFFTEVTPHIWLLSGQWVIWTVLLSAIGLFVVLRGVSLSVKLLLALTLLGMAALVVFDIAILAQGGAHGIAWSSLLFWKAPGISGMSLLAALGLAIYTLSGLEGAVYLAEETENPTRTVPRAVFIAAAIAYGFFLLTALAIVTGYGQEAAGAEWSTRISGALFDLSSRYLFPGYGYFLLGMVALAGFAVAIANANGTVRLMYSWARSGFLPKVLASTHPRFRTPHVATAVVATTIVLTLLIILPLQGGSAQGAFNSFTFLSLVGAANQLLAYAMVGAAGFVYGRRHDKGIVFTYIAPLLCVTVMVLAMSTFFVPSLPAAPFTAAPFVGAALVIAGIVYVFRIEAKTKRLQSVQV